MFSLKKFVATIIVASSMFSVPAFAGGGASAGAEASAGASAVVETTNKGGIGAASLGVGNCGGGVVLGPIGISGMTPTCKRDILANYFAKRGDFALADQIMMGDPIVQKAMEEMASAKKAKPAVGTATTASTKSLAKPALMTYNGEFAKFTTKAQTEILACKALYNSKQITACVGKY